MDYKEAKATLGERDSKKLANNTYLERTGENEISVRLHSTYILRFRPTFTEYNDGGWTTPTTWSRMRNYGPMGLGSNGKQGMELYAVTFQAPYSCDYDCDSQHDFKSGFERIGESKSFRCVYCGKVKEGSSRADWQTAFVYYSGIRVKPDGSGLMKTQPNRPNEPEPIVSRSGWTGLSRGESQRRNNERFSRGFLSAVHSAQEERAVRADDSLSMEDKREALAVPDKPKTIYLQSCPFLIFDPSHYGPMGYCKCEDAEEQTRMCAEWDYSPEDFKAHNIRFVGSYTEQSEGSEEA